jgi:hypothetical protein
MTVAFTVPMTPLLQKALLEIGDVGRGALYEVALPQATLGGDWKLVVNGFSSLPLLRLCERDDVRDALELLPPIGAGNVEVVGAIGGPFRIQLCGALGAQRMDATLFAFSADGSQLDPPAQLVVTPLDLGAGSMLESKGAQYEAEYVDVANDRLRFLYVKRDLLQISRGEAQKGIDEASGDQKREYSQQFDQLSRLFNDVMVEIEKLTSPSATATPGSSGVPYSGVIAKKTPNGLPYGVLGSRSGRRF